MSITCIFRNWEKLRAINDRPYEKTGMFSIKDVGARRERPKTTMRKKFLGIGGGGRGAMRALPVADKAS